MAGGERFLQSFEESCAQQVEIQSSDSSVYEMAPAETTDTVSVQQSSARKL